MNMTAPQLKQLNKGKEIEQDICLFGQTNFRNQLIRFGIKTDDRRRHMYIIGRTGTGKTTLLKDFLVNTKLKYRLDNGDDIMVQEILNSQKMDKIFNYF